MKDKHILVLGLGKSGISTVRILVKLGNQVHVNDSTPEEMCPYIEELRQLGVKYTLGSHPLSLLSQPFDYVVKSPGIPYSNSLLQKAKEKNITIITEIELGYQLTSSQLIGITGTNGKTTVTSLTGHILSNNDVSNIVCGNIGTVFSEQAFSYSPEWFVTELSSFQLAGIDQYKPTISCFLNFNETHLDFHGTIEDYFQSKCAIFKNQTKKEKAILNADCSELVNYASSIKAECYWFSTKKEVSQGAFLKNGILYIKTQGDMIPIIETKDIPLPGEHNIENVLAAILLTFLSGVSPEKIKKSIQTFQAVEHRLEWVDSIVGVSYYNDSKSTNSTSAIKAIASFSEPLIYLAGGKDRGSTFEDMLPILKQAPVKAVILHGESTEKLKRIAEKADIPVVHCVSSVAESVALAHTLSENGDVVLFSPACASWGLYSSFEERGRDFKQHVHQLKLQMTAK